MGSGDCPNTAGNSPASSARVTRSLPLPGSPPPRRVIGPLGPLPGPPGPLPSMVAAEGPLARAAVGASSVRAAARATKTKTRGFILAPSRGGQRWVASGTPAGMVGFRPGAAESVARVRLNNPGGPATQLLLNLR